ncbi:MAG: DUF4278 domain-containing protein [Hydrococcus sp. C42_A2020_068]|nr:hypothetical protein Ple7327_0582 [Pleurocapsa sp. PCC 7327]MBF2021889.1 DUF4278 domain-containing protein [Hydrococcus sp. C42_A2020_068]
MRWLFLIPLTTGLISGYISQKSADEIAYLTGALTIMSLLASLVMAPWQVQLLILVLVFIIVRQFWLKLEFESQLETEQQEKADVFRVTSTPNEVERKTIRKYRGVTYEPPASTSSVTEVEIEGKYRGATCKVHYLQQTSDPLHKRDLDLKEQ